MLTDKPCARPCFPPNVFVFRHYGVAFFSDFFSDEVEKMGLFGKHSPVLPLITDRRVLATPNVVYCKVTKTPNYNEITYYQPTPEDIEADDWYIYGGDDEE